MKKAGTMPKVRFNPLIEEIRGTMYDVVFKRSPKGTMIITKRPDMSRVKWSPAQEAHRQRFSEAVAYARAALADPKVRASYERKAKKQHKRAWDLAVSEYFQTKALTPPTKGRPRKPAK
jgi:hypothetical protein